MLRILSLIGYLVITAYASDYINYPDVQQSYMFYEKAQSWFDAWNTCRKDDATLAMPKNDAEMAVLKNIFDKYPIAVIKDNTNPHYVLLGFHDMFKEGEYVTTKGIPIQYYYHTWSANQPDNSGNNENCASMGRTGELNDLPCNISVPFICQKNKKEVNYFMNSDCNSPDPAYKYSNETNKCYKLHLNPKTWPEARTICQSEGGNLAIINNKPEEDFLVKMFTNPKDKVNHVTNKNFALLGFHDIFREGHFLTVEDEELKNIGYTNWASNQPNAGDENCGAMDTFGKLHDYACNSIAVFFCEIDSKINKIQIDSDLGQTKTPSPLIQPLVNQPPAIQPSVIQFPLKNDPGHFFFFYSSNRNA